MNDRKKPGTSEIVTARRGADGEWTGHPDAVREALASVKAASERARRWPETPEGYVDVLARSFPVIARDADGIAPWDVDRFLFWLCGPAPSSGALHAGRFLLSVWNPSTDWIEQAREKGIDGAGAAKRFDLFDAVRRLGRCARVCVHGLDRSAVLAVVGDPSVSVALDDDVAGEIVVRAGVDARRTVPVRDTRTTGSTCTRWARAWGPTRR